MEEWKHNRCESYRKPNWNDNAIERHMALEPDFL